MTPNTISRLLRTIDPETMRHHSILNYHVNGMDYLCLHRTEDLTIKIYLIEEPRNVHGLYLVNPHNHRYSFSTVVLNGQVDHVQFVVTEGHDWEICQYNPDSKVCIQTGECNLVPIVRSHWYRNDYWCDADTIHSLGMKPRAGPLVLGLTQLRKERETSSLFLPYGCGGEFYAAASRTPNLEEMIDLIKRAQFYTDRHINVYDKEHPDLFGYKARHLNQPT